MKEATRNKKKIPFNDLKASNLNLFGRRRAKHGDFICCGSAALSLLTGIHPFKIDLECSNPFKGWHTGPAIKFLRECGFTCIELAKADVLNCYWQRMPLTRDHCLLINCHMDNNENSMVVVHNDTLWHNFDHEPFLGTWFLNKPTQDVWLIYHPKWAALKSFKRDSRINILFEKPRRRDKKDKRAYIEHVLGKLAGPEWNVITKSAKGKLKIK